MKLSDERIHYWFTKYWADDRDGQLKPILRDIAEEAYALGVAQARRVKPLDRYGLVYRGYAVSIDDQEKRYVAELARGDDTVSVGIYRTGDCAWEACQAHHDALILSALEDV